MKKRKKKKTSLPPINIANTKSTEYTTEELILLGKKNNIVKIAPPLYKLKTDDNLK